MKSLQSFCLLVLLLFPLGVTAETIIPETIPTGTWTAAGNPYRLESSAILPADSLLVIEEGVIVLADHAKSLTFYGGCQVMGTQEKPVLFTSSTDGQTWGGLRFWENTQVNSMIWATVEYGDTYDPQIHGGGVSIREADFSMRHCTIRFNHATLDGGGVLIYEGDVAIDSCTFYGNIADRCGGAIDFAGGSTGIFDQNLLWENEALNGGAIYFYDGDVIADHLTCYNNVAWEENSVARWYFSSSVITNSILWDANDTGMDLISFWMDGVEYSCVSDSTLFGNGLLFNDPEFLDPSSHDFRLTPGSPCIDAGDPNSETDPDGSICDLGALWFGTAQQQEDLIIGLNDPVVEPGGTGVLFLTIATLSDQAIFSLQGDLNLPFPPILEVTDLSLANPGPGSEAGWMVEWSILDAGIRFAAAGGSDLQGTGPLLAVQFTISPDAQEGEYPIFCTSLMANEGTPGVISPGATLTVSNFPLGDVSLNHELQAFDASMILQWLGQTVELTGLQQYLGEVSGNDELTAFDASLILQRVSGLIESFPAESGQPAPYGSTSPSFELQNLGNGTCWLDLELSGCESVGSIEFRLNYHPAVVDISTLSTTIEGCQLVKTPLPNGAIVSLVFDQMLSGDAATMIIEFLFNVDWIDGDDLLITGMRVNDGSWVAMDQTFNLWNTSVKDGLIPISAELLSTYPNPFNPTLNINIAVEKNSAVEVQIVDVLGRQVTTLANRTMNRGVHLLQWNATGLSSGVYYVRVRIGQQVLVRKVVYLR